MKNVMMVIMFIAIACMEIAAIVRIFDIRPETNLGFHSIAGLNNIAMLFLLFITFLAGLVLIAKAFINLLYK
jgi:hypothetical protein